MGQNDSVAVEQRYRDVLKGWEAMRDNVAVYAVLGIENQSYIDYAMPTRAMIYDAIQYAAQVDKIRKIHRAEKFAGMDSDEVLSGYGKEDKLTPVVTLVLYFGASKWSGPMSLHDMMNTHDNALLKFVQNYQLSIVTPNDLQDIDFERFTTNLGRVLKYVKYCDEMEKLAIMVSNDERYRSLDEESARLINAVTNSKLEFEVSEGKVDMCKAIDEMRKESWDQGREDMRREMAPAIKEMCMNSWKQGREDMQREMINALVSAGLVTESEAIDALCVQGVA
ncbi:MAG: Rpn family recombination-promoting nuclease/putative transposase [Atopobiaceae bacterium]|nr:Rpn family recombination-promoting nuclease/putative transposase [Atopobiaceae bacterium]